MEKLFELFLEQPNNQKCKNFEKCVFLHQLVTNKDIIIDENTKFSYSEHLNMSKKII